MKIPNEQEQSPVSNFYQNISEFIPPPIEVQRELWTFYYDLQSSFEEALRLVIDEYFNEKQYAIDKSLLCTMMRYHVKRLMKQKEKVDLFNLKDLNNIGLAGTYKGYSIRILKDDDGELPIPNSSDKAAYFCQQLSFFEGVEEKDKRPNIIFLWGLNSNYGLKPMILCCPKYAEKGKDVSSVYFSELLPHPATVGTVPNEEITAQPLNIEMKETVYDINQDNIRRENKTS